jgi:hypothetical protein
MFTNGAPIAPLYAIVDAAKHFGLTDDDVLRAVDDCFYSADIDSTVGECMDELVSVLARRILRTVGESSRSRRPPW